MKRRAPGFTRGPAVRRCLAAGLAIGLAACTWAGTSHAADRPLGRLLLTPSERALLDRRAARGIGAAGADGPAAAVSAPGIVAPDNDAPTRLDGVMRTDAGPPVVWVNGKPQRLDGESYAAPSALHLQGDEVSIQLPGGNRVLLRPGQSEAAR